MPHPDAARPPAAVAGRQRGISAALPLLALPLGGACLLFGLLAGLIRLGWDLPAPAEDLVLWHGPLMVSGFFGTLIALERAVAMRRTWTYAAPALTGIGGIALAAGAPMPAAAAAMALGSLIYMAANCALGLRHPETHIAVLALAGAAWFAGDVAWLAGFAVPQVVLAWVAFLVLTIAGERLELSRLAQPPRRARAVFLGIVLLLLIGVAAGFAADATWRPTGTGLLALAVWLARYDIARRTIRGRGVARFSATCLLSGYTWLAVAGLYALLSPDPAAGFAYDAILHAVFLGFVFAMVFGHAPIILPAVARIRVPFRTGFYAPLALLHAGLALRLCGDALVWQAGRSWGGLLDALAILGFIAVVTGAVLLPRARGAAQPAHQ